jgi:hypothetical protein
MAEESTRLGALKRPNTYPDFAGQFLHAVGERLLDSLVNNDDQIVNESFGYYFASSLMQFDHLRAKADFQDWRGLSAMKVAVAPILDLMSLSGYCMLLAEVHDNSELSKNIIDVWNEYLDGADSGGANVLTLLVSVISVTDSAFEIAHRSLIRSAWSQSVARALGKIKRRHIRGRGAFSPHRTVADHKSALVRVFAGEHYISTYDGIDVFVEMFLKQRAKMAGVAVHYRRRNLGDAIVRQEKNWPQEISPDAGSEQEFEDEDD